MTLDGFVEELLTDNERAVSKAIDEMAQRLQRPPASPRELLEILNRDIPRSVERLRG